MNIVHSQQTDQLLQYCKATADSLRLDILRILCFESFGVLEIARILDIPQPALSHHLKILSKAGLLDTRREGNSIYYRRSLISFDNTFRNFHQSLFESIDQLELSAQIQARMASVHEERGRHSLEFFSRNADQFKENQDLIVSLDQYSSSLKELIDNEKLNRACTAMEIGPGSGELLPYLANSFSKVIALDNSREMLARAQESIPTNSNIEFRHGDISVGLGDLCVDLILMNMVLHHNSSPAKVFHSAQKALHDDGIFVVIDLCPHHQGWVRQTCGDLWLGFEPGDLDEWANEANLQPRQSVYLGMRNGFQIQMRIYNKPPTRQATDNEQTRL